MALQDGSSPDRLWGCSSGAPDQPPGMGGAGAVGGAGVRPAPSLHQLLPRRGSPKPSGPGRQCAGLGRQSPLTCQSCPRAASPPGSHPTPRCSPAPRGAASVPGPACATSPTACPGETRARAGREPAEPNQGGFTLTRALQRCSSTKGRGGPAPPILLPSQLIKLLQLLGFWG